MIPKFRFFGKVNDGTERMVRADTIDFKNGFIYYSYRQFTVEGDDHVYGDVIGFEDCVLMQSTGLFDKNGKEIFEGDVVKIVDENGDSEISAVAFKEGACGMTITGVFVPFVTMIMEATVDYTLEVIGNIYENPELAEAEND